MHLIGSGMGCSRQRYLGRRIDRKNGRSAKRGSAEHLSLFEVGRGREIPNDGAARRRIAGHTAGGGHFNVLQGDVVAADTRAGDKAPPFLDAVGHNGILDIIPTTHIHPAGVGNGHRHALARGWHVKASGQRDASRARTAVNGEILDRNRGRANVGIDGLDRADILDRAGAVGQSRERDDGGSLPRPQQIPAGHHHDAGGGIVSRRKAKRNRIARRVVHVMRQITGLEKAVEERGRGYVDGIGLRARTGKAVGPRGKVNSRASTARPVQQQCPIRQKTERDRISFGRSCTYKFGFGMTGLLPSGRQPGSNVRRPDARDAIRGDLPKSSRI